MHSFTAAALCVLPILARAFELPDTVPLDRRMEVDKRMDAAEYECHEDCGTVIIIGRSSDYCDNTTFTEDLSDCLDCALEYDIWQYYGDDVASAAESCGLDATPVSATSSASVASATAASAATTEAVAASTTAASSSAAITSAATTSGSNSSSNASISATASPTASSFTGGVARSSVLNNIFATLVVVGLGLALI
ncbi:MAG: hypothetical protein M1834_000833 [Cirrosporium novae-zelandiae]|nr:MAG: hypothetical protein M1834_000833 [Cirrosporium novae-zelandiae]